MFILLAIEEKLNVVMENYAEFEQSLLDITITNMVFHNLDWDSMTAARQTIVRRIINLLSSCRSYLDQKDHDLGAISTVTDDIIREVKKSFSQQYDARLGYRVMEEMRNHVQHRGSSVYHLAYPSGWRGDIKTDDCWLEFNITASFTRKDLERDGEFKQRILDELPTDEPIDLKAQIRDYVAGISEAHQTLRRLLDQTRKNACTLLRDAIAQYESQAEDGDATGLHFVQRDSDGNLLRAHSLFSDPIDRLDKLHRRNPLLSKLHRFYVTSHVESDFRTEPT